MITKFSRMGSLPDFFTYGAPLRASRARTPPLISVSLVLHVFEAYMHVERGLAS